MNTIQKLDEIDAGRSEYPNPFNFGRGEKVSVFFINCQSSNNCSTVTYLIYPELYIKHQCEISLKLYPSQRLNLGSDFEIENLLHTHQWVNHSCCSCLVLKRKFYRRRLRCFGVPKNFERLFLHQYPLFLLGQLLND